MLERSVKYENKSFRGLLYPPALENEVYVLFGMLLPYLDDQFIIEKFTSSPAFPDCFAERNGKRIGIEFEVDSKNFFAHKHHEDPNLPKCNMIICWKNYLPDSIKINGKDDKIYTIEILELSKVVKDKSLKPFLYDKPRATPNEWDEKRFLEKLKEKVGEGETYNWTKELIEICKSYDEFVIAPGKGKRQATVGFHIKSWLSEGIGVPTPIQFLDDGSVVFDYKNMPENVEKKLRSKFKHPKGRWRKIHIRSHNTFNTLKEAFTWLAETISTKKSAAS